MLLFILTLLFDQVSEFKVYSESFREISLHYSHDKSVSLYMKCNVRLPSMCDIMEAPTCKLSSRKAPVNLERTKVQPAQHYYRTHNKKVTALKIWSC